MRCEDTAHFPEDCRGLCASATSAAGTRASFSSRCSTAAGSALTAFSTCSLRAVSNLITAMKLLTKDTLRELPCLSEAGKPGRKTRLPYLLHAADICPAITRGSVRHRSLPCCLLGTVGERYKTNTTASHICRLIRGETVGLSFLGHPALRRQAKYVASNKARISGTPQ